LIKAQKTCIQKTPKLQFNGNLIGLKSKIDSVDQCLSLCTAQAGCKSINYLASSKVCHIMDMLLNTNDESQMRLYVKENADSTYVGVACTEDGKPLPPPVLPTAPPVGKPIPAGSCGQSGFDMRQNQRIVGGYEARPHSAPWIVSMSRIMGIHFCGGTLIRVNPKVDESDIFITAAHCVEDVSRNVTALFGAHNNEKPEEGTVAIPVAKIIPHPKYRMKAFNDIAIMKLVRPVKFGPWIQPACLPAAGEIVPEGTTSTIHGWGRSAEEGTSPPTLHQVSLPVITTQSCAAIFKKNDYPLVLNPEIMLCAAYPEGGKDTCQGDSGGPLVVKSSNGYVLQGVVSFGKGCARAGWPGVYARVSAQIDWINETIKSVSTVASG